jgi:hypothetical protein
VAQTNCGLPRVDADAEHFELENCAQVTDVGRRQSLHTKARLPHGREPMPIFAELIIEGREFGRTKHVEPRGIVLLGLVSHVEHREAIHLETRALISDGH